MGLAQTLGFNYEVVGYASVQDMFTALSSSIKVCERGSCFFFPFLSFFLSVTLTFLLSSFLLTSFFVFRLFLFQAQLNAFLSFIVNNPSLLSSLRQRNWNLFAEVYNGPGLLSLCFFCFSLSLPSPFVGFCCFCLLAQPSFPFLLFLCSPADSRSVAQSLRANWEAIRLVLEEIHYTPSVQVCAPFSSVGFFCLFSLSFFLPSLLLFRSFIVSSVCFQESADEQEEAHPVQPSPDANQQKKEEVEQEHEKKMEEKIEETKQEIKKEEDQKHTPEEVCFCV
jgi:hypothetical protein